MTECLDPANFYLALEKNSKLVAGLEKELKDYIEGGHRRRFREKFDKFVASNKAVWEGKFPLNLKSMEHVY